VDLTCFTKKEMESLNYKVAETWNIF